MKLMIASDIHGSAKYCSMLLDAFAASGADRLLLLGDLLYHGPRNDLPDEYSPKKVTQLLNAVSGSLLCVRGNCEAEVDQMVLDFPVMADYCILCESDRMIFATHGHLFSESSPPKLNAGDILLCGHTHVPALTEHDSFTYVNTGSVSMPKNGTPHSFVLLDGGVMTWRALDAPGSSFMEYIL